MLLAPSFFYNVLFFFYEISSMNFKQITSLSVLAAAAMVAAAPAQATIAVNSAAFSYSESFDTLATTGTANVWTNDSTVAGWSLFKTNSTTAVASYIADAGTLNNGGIHSYGTTTERALGGVGSSSFALGWIAVAFTNTTAGSFSGFKIGFDGEQWRDGGAATPVAQSMVMEYGFGATFAAVTTWTAPGGAFNWSSPVTANLTTGAAVDGNGAGKVAGLGGDVSTPWASNDTLWVRWIEKNDAGNDHGLAIDNVSLTVMTAAVPEPSTYALLLAGLGAVGFVARRRKQA
ncbi:PEP-CTERM sorting domain-containing protein [Roseateles oligotrophus]|uniref:PEP-CTERM sorting domain-containing protein n=1 Tax=Roseateles oligotrophus TaxID=1769250 RepID=A0ABT2YKR4_9BURK|nr:PEP-CTERM sorting domain-containing protein [Roseateles oligotrophus]MCV2370653.1 PEP-CTERM sorting domain-containing protein [Roseateles oligotrophus]